MVVEETRESSSGSFSNLRMSSTSMLTQASIPTSSPSLLLEGINVTEFRK